MVAFFFYDAYGRLSRLFNAQGGVVALRRVLWLFLLVGLLLIPLSYFFIDRPVVWFFVAQQTRRFALLKMAANDIVSVLSGALFLFYCYAIVKYVSASWSLFDKKALAVCHAVVASLFLKDVLKTVSGRYWIDTFQCDNASLIRDNLYGFNWFVFDGSYGAFPSGHTTFMVALAASMWILFPRVRWWAVGLALIVALAQIVMYYHFVSDVMGGIVLGSMVGVVVARTGFQEGECTIRGWP